MTIVEDAELANRLANRDPSAMAEASNRFYGPLFRYLWHCCDVREDAEDLASQALIKVASEAHRYRGDGPLRAWVFKVAHRELLMHRRRKLVSALFERRSSAPDEMAPPSDELIVARQALARLPEDQRAAFLLVAVEGFSVEEASESLGIPSGTVKSRCFHARRKLRELLSPSEPIQGGCVANAVE